MTLRTALAASHLCLAACLAATPRPPQAPLPAPGVVDGVTGRRLAGQGVKVIDVRSPEEFAEGHVPGAINIQVDDVSARAGEIGPPSTPVLLYCRTGRRSAIAAETLQSKGFTAVYNMRTYDAWRQAEPGR